MIAGVDYSTFAVDIVRVDVNPLDDACDHLRFELRRRGDTGDLAAWRAARRARDLDGWSGWFDVALAYVERGFGASRRSDFLLGRVQGAVVAAIPAHVAVEEITAAEWKKEIGLRHNCKPDEYVAHLRGLGYDLPDENAYAALGMALAVRRMNAREIVRAEG